MKNTKFILLRSILISLSLIGAMLANGCGNTVDGIGEDAEDLGDSIKDSTN